MNEIAAFVGHSFLDDDRGVVNAFLEYLEQVRSVLPYFSWAHATTSEPREVSEKVLSLIEGKNTFIGICTRKERAVSNSYLHPLFLRPNSLYVDAQRLEWKTSDWVIQEIGLAVGRKMNLILLVEDGVRPPGALQGNIEYIPFSRVSPSNSFGKLLEMISALAPSSTAVSTTAAESTAPLAVADAKPSPPAQSASPRAEWTRDEYLHAFFVRLLDDDNDGAEEINRAYLQTEHASGMQERVDWEADVEWGRLVFGKGDNLDRLRALEAQNPDNRKVKARLAAGLARYGEHVEAAKMHEVAAALADEPSGQVNQLCAAAGQYAHAGQFEVAESTIDEALARAGEDRALTSAVLSAILDIAAIQGDDELQIEALEAKLEHAPDDTNERFNLAYKHSEYGNGDLAFFNYLKIPASSRSAIAWNNIGVSFQEFGMQGRAVDAYRKAAEQDETLAMANLAYKYLNTGFFEEARDILDKALSISDFHKNVGECVAALRAAPDNEATKEADALKAAQQKAAFYRALGQALIQRNPATVHGEWIGPVCNIIIKISGNTLTATGEYQLSRNVFSSILDPEGPPVTHYIEYSGRIWGRRVGGTIKRWSSADSRIPSYVGKSTPDPRFLMYLSNENSVFHVMEIFGKGSPTFYSFRRQ